MKYGCIEFPALLGAVIKQGGKRAVTKTDRSITFKYDPMRNRVAKYTKPNSSNLEKRTYYIRDAQGNVMATYSAWVKNNSGVITWDSMRLSEQHIYGSARVGMALTNVKLHPQVPKNPHLPDTSRYPIFEGWKRYEISNHLGNVLAVITDRKHSKAASGTAIQWFEADLVAAQQYYPFGMLMPGDGPGVSASWKRQYTLNGNDYRYGFNGKEGDDDLKGDDNQQDYGMRIYDPRVGRFLSVDPLAKNYPWNSVYAFAENDVIRSIDLDGAERMIRINYYDVNGNIGRTKILTLTDNQTGFLVNYQTQVNNNPLAGNPEILEINKADPGIPGSVVPATVNNFNTFGTAGTGNAPLVGTTANDNAILARSTRATITINNIQTGGGGQRANMQFDAITNGPNTFTLPGSNIPDSNPQTDTYTSTQQELPAPIQINFRGNSALPVNQAQSVNAIAPLVAFLNDRLNAASTITLTGNTGTNGTSSRTVYGTGPGVWNQPLENPNWTDQNGIARTGGTVGLLMIARASYARNLLISNGINPNRITGMNSGTVTSNVNNRTVTPTVSN